MNLGVQDAADLGWKLAAEVRGWAPAGQGEEIAAVRTLTTELLRLPDTNRYLSGVMSGLDIRYPGVGPRMIDLEPLDGRQRSVGHRSDRVEHVAAKTDEDVAGAEALLIRPDGYIAWSTTDGGPLEPALTRWFG
ncbi:FAD-dependent monooxygenase [Streptomyces sp. NPDC004237]|uniref:aromatic-ring hydroxylase C-terminal domain-containing protein n=1 Tax=Streptomyces sp. NPDC004237 TaxID=3154455 RepID=UPI0033BA1DD3